MSVLNLGVVLLVITLVSLEKEAFGQTLFSCATWPISPLLSVDCLVDNGAFCDAHCRCIHGAKWGNCIPRPTGSLIPILNQIMCRCNYDTDPPAGSANPLDGITCALWMTTNYQNYLCNSVQGSTGACTTDCVCSHGYQKGTCDDTTQVCLCSDN